MSMDISDFYQTFFDEADELLADMEQHLLDLVPEAPDSEQLNAIFRAAHSIKGGAGTFGFTILQETTHLMENLLDEARRGEMQLNTDIINLFLETKDIMQEQLDAYKSSAEPDAASFEYICNALRQLALEAKGEVAAAVVPAAKLSVVDTVAAQASAPADAPAGKLRVVLSRLKENEVNLLEEELGNLAKLSNVVKGKDSLAATLDDGIGQDDIVAVLCFVIEADQIAFETETVAVDVPAAVEEAAVVAQAAAPAVAPAAPALKAVPKEAAAPGRGEKPAARSSESTSIRVAVEKVDQLINLVGELVITQSMLAQRSNELDPVTHGDLITSMGQLQRNARDLQESVMSIRMMPMEYVFSRFPRLVRDLASKLNKQIELTLMGSSTELDKSLIERIIDPLTHLVRNSLDHGIELPENRIAAGKSPVGNLILSAEHQGGNICIEVTDDGAGLNRERILAKAISQEIRGYDQVTRIANTPAFIKGVTNLRGVIVPIVDLRVKFSQGDVDYNDNTVVIVLNLGQRVVGIVVDGVSDVLSLTSDQIRPAPEFAVTLSTEYLTGLGALGERMLILVNIEKLLNSDEMALLDIAASHVA